MPKPLIVEHAPALSVLCLLLGCVMIVVGVVGRTSPASDHLESSDLLLIFIGMIVAAVGALWLFSFVKKTRKFNVMMKEKSKAVFVKKLDELEYMAWLLPMRYEQELLERKQELGLK